MEEIELRQFGRYHKGCCSVCKKSRLCYHYKDEKNKLICRNCFDKLKFQGKLSLKKQKVFVNCSLCGNAILTGNYYYSLEIGCFKIEDNKETTPININELFVWCDKCHKKDFMKRINVNAP